MQTTERVSPLQTEHPSPTDSRDPFDYAAAFSRNLGLVQPDEQLRLKRTVVAIAGLGGVGGVHLTTLARLGVGGFHIADFDSFEIHNFNRQAGATLDTLGRPKVDVMADQLLQINPHAKLRRFETGINRGNIEAFLDGVDVVVDGIDFFAVEARELLYDEAERRGIPLVTAGPIGMSVAWLVFKPGSMPWRDYFAFDLARSTTDKILLFALGLTPAATHLSYLDRSSVDIDAHRGPSLSLAVQLCAGTAAAEVLKLVLKRGDVKAAPHYHQFDVYKGRLATSQLRWGNRGWGQRLKAFLFKRLLANKSPQIPTSFVDPILGNNTVGQT
ncbi:MAG: ThiF family adenylyltransferase [Elusimicrobia bacterium]|nr:ThiF family adenylyltransferase [Elusimicrobiota bacterium]